MIKITDNLWVGNAIDEQRAKVDSILNVANDLHQTRGLPQGIKYHHIGLIDGPGNLMEDYYAAVLALVAMVKLGGNVIICCHEGKSRSMAVALMYVNLIRMDLWVDWRWHLGVIREKNDADIPEPHPAHMAMFDTLNWKLLKEIACIG